MLLFKPEIVQMLRGVSEIWTEHKDELSQIDSRFGDGDHGVTIGKIAAKIRQSLDEWQDDDVETFLEDLGDEIMAIGGGSAGPLYGTMIGGLAGGVPESVGLDAGAVKRMFAASLEAVSYTHLDVYKRQKGYMVTGWVTWKDKEYYCGDDGVMLVNTVTPDGERVGPDGSRQ